MNALARLILKRKEELGLSWPEIAKRGGFSSHTIVYAIATKKEHKQTPRPDTLKRLAKALDLPLDVVKMAAADAAGYRHEEIQVTLEGAENLRVVAAVLGDLDPADADMLRNLAVSFHEQVKKRREGDA